MQPDEPRPQIVRAPRWISDNEPNRLTLKIKSLTSGLTIPDAEHDQQKNYIFLWRKLLNDGEELKTNRSRKRPSSGRENGLQSQAFSYNIRLVLIASPGYCGKQSRAREDNERMNRHGLKSLVISFGALLATAGAYAAEPNIVEAAKKEGKLVAYVSMLTENATSLLAEFKKRYPFIETSLYRANTQKLLPKIQLEARTQQHEADVISATFTI